MNKAVLAEIHRYWFGELASPTDYPAERIPMWFRPTPEIDDHIRAAYGRHLEAAAAIEWDLPSLTREQQIGLVILFDQFPRQIFRTTGQAFAYDAKALAITRSLIDGGMDRFFWAERLFLVTVFSHVEDIAMQDYSVLIHAQLALAAPPGLVESFRRALDQATKHRDVIRKFGRYPHRNTLVGRESTPEEVEFLKGGRGF